MIEDEFAGERIQPVGEHAGDDKGDQHVQALGGQTAGPAHALEAFRPMQFDLPGAMLGFEDVGGHELWLPRSTVERLKGAYVTIRSGKFNVARARRREAHRRARIFPSGVAASGECVPA